MISFLAVGYTFAVVMLLTLNPFTRIDLVLTIGAAVMACRAWAKLLREVRGA